jgi:hypothetical protein
MEPEVSLTMSISQDDVTDFTEKSDGQYDSEQDCDMNMRMEDDVNAPDRVDYDDDVDMERDGDDDEEEAEEKEDDEEVEEEDEDEEEDMDKDDGKEFRTIGQGEIVKTSADDADTMADDEPTVQLQQGKDICGHTPRPQPLAPAPQQQTLEPPPRLRTPETHTFSGLEFLGLLTQ